MEYKRRAVRRTSRVEDQREHDDGVAAMGHEQR
jgi:hypothetical protein